MNAQGYLRDALTLLKAIEANDKVEIAQRRQAVLQLPLLIRTHGLAAVVQVINGRISPEPMAGANTETSRSTAGKRLHKQILDDVMAKVNAVVGSTQPELVGRRTQVALDYLDSVARLLDGVLPKPTPERCDTTALTGALEEANHA